MKDVIFDESTKKWQVRQMIKDSAREKGMNPKEYVKEYPECIESICKMYGVESFDYEAGDGIF